MPAPPNDLIAALRAGTVARHLFFKMDHSQGEIRAWDGVGVQTFQGQDYLGVGGFAKVEGISDSGDVQNHEILVSLNGAGLPGVVDAGVSLPEMAGAVAESDLNIRGRVAEIWAAWITEDGTMLNSRRLVRGKGDVLKIKPEADSLVVTARIRPPLAEWSSPPRAYYTPEDQELRFSGDTGFDYVKNLENLTVSGWSNVAEAGGGSPIISYAPDRRPWFHPVASSLTGQLIGDDALGIVVCGENASFTTGIVKMSLTAQLLPTVNYEEEILAVDPLGVAANAEILCSGAAMSIDGSNVIRTANGNRVVRNGQLLSNFLRVQTQIASNGTPSAERVQVRRVTFQPLTLVRESDNTKEIYCNKNGTIYLNASEGSKASFLTDSGGVKAFYPDYYEEEETGIYATGTGTYLKIGGGDCVISNTGVVLSPAGRKIVLHGGDPTKEFLRVWV